MTKKIISNEEFIRRVTLKHGNKFNLSKVNFINYKTKIHVICDKHGEFEIQPINLLHGKHICRQCYIDSKYSNLETFITKAKVIHGDKYDYTKSIYTGSHNKLIVICPVHGEFNIDPHHHLLGCGCYHCGREKIVASKKSSLEEFIEKARKIHGDKFNYSKVVYIDSVTKVIIICPEHGEFLMTPNDHLSGQGCRQCSNIKLSLKFRLTLEEFITKARAVHGDKYDYSKVIYLNAHTKVIIICPEHGEFLQTPNSHLSGNGCLKCSSSKGEMFIANILNEQGIKYIREYKIPGSKQRYRYDFYLPTYNLLIEFHGGQHFKPIPYFGGEKSYRETRMRDSCKRTLAKMAKIPLLEFNYKQLRDYRYFKKFILKKLSIFKCKEQGYLFDEN